MTAVDSNHKFLGLTSFPKSSQWGKYQQGLDTVTFASGYKAVVNYVTDIIAPFLCATSTEALCYFNHHEKNCSRLGWRDGPVSEGSTVQARTRVWIHHSHWSPGWKALTRYPRKGGMFVTMAQVDLWTSLASWVGKLTSSYSTRDPPFSVIKMARAKKISSATPWFPYICAHMWTYT